MSILIYKYIAFKWTKRRLKIIELQTNLIKLFYFRKYDFVAALDKTRFIYIQCYTR